MSHNHDFQKFMNAQSGTTPQLDRAVDQIIRGQLPRHIFVKFLIIQLSVGVVSLLACPQFGIGPLGGGHGIAHIFMEHSLWACAAFCSVFFFLTGAFFVRILLSSVERRYLRASWKTWAPAFVTIVMLVLLFGGWMLVGITAFHVLEYIIVWWLMGLVSLSTLKVA